MLNVYSILVILTILIITVGLFPKLIQKKGLTGPCSGRYEKSQPLVLPTPKAGGHFVPALNMQASTLAPRLQQHSHNN